MVSHLNRTARWGSLILIFIVTFTLLHNIAWAARFITVSSSTLNVRSGPSTTYSKIGQVTLGQRLQVLSERNGWYQISLGSGKTGWVSGEYVKEIKETQTIARQGENLPQQVMITGSTVNVRSGPGTTFTKVADLSKGTVVKVTGKTNDWYQIVLSSGKTGWVATWLTEPVSVNTPGPVIPQPTEVKQVTVTASSLNIRSSPDINSAKLTTVPMGTRLDVTGQAGDWYQVVLSNGQRGWVAGWLVQLNNTAISAWNYQAPAFPVMVPGGGSGSPMPQHVVWQTEKMDWGTRIYVTGTGVIDYTVSRQTSPPRILIEIKGQAETETNLLPLFHGSVNSIKANSSLDRLQLEVDLRENVSYQAKLNQEGTILTIDIGFSPVWGKIIVLDAGHGSIQPGGWTDPGAVGSTGLTERDVVMDITEKTAALLTAQGARVVMTRTGPATSLTLEGRAQVANQIPADIFVSIHANASPNREISGTSTFFYAPLGTELGVQRVARQSLANFIQNRLVQRIQRIDLGLREQNFAVLRHTIVPSVLVETVFISNYQEEALLADDGFRAVTAAGIAEGISDYFVWLSR